MRVQILFYDSRAGMCVRPHKGSKVFTKGCKSVSGSLKFFIWAHVQRNNGLRSVIGLKVTNQH